jgi:hypothetical protein
LIYVSGEVVDPDALIRIEAALRRVLSTARGQEMIERLKRDNRRVVIWVNSDGDQRADFFRGYLYIDPSDLPTYLSSRGERRANLERVIAHELGHAVFNETDEGPGELNNILRNEDPVMAELYGHDKYGPYRRILY